jgi:hypothetical protein
MNRQAPSDVLRQALDPGGRRAQRLDTPGSSGHPVVSFPAAGVVKQFTSIRLSALTYRLPAVLVTSWAPAGEEEPSSPSADRRAVAHKGPSAPGDPNTGLVPR